MSKHRYKLLDYLNNTLNKIGLSATVQISRNRARPPGGNDGLYFFRKPEIVAPFQSALAFAELGRLINLHESELDPGAFKVITEYIEENKFFPNKGAAYIPSAKHKEIQTFLGVDE